MRTAPRTVSAASRLVAAIVSASLVLAPVGPTFAAEGMGRVTVPGVYGFLPMNSGPYVMNAMAKDKDGKDIQCDDWSWEASNPVGGSTRVINRSISGVGLAKDTYSFWTGSDEGAARVEVKCKVKDRVVAEGVALVSTKRGEKEETREQAQTQATGPQATPPSSGLGGALLIGGLVAGAAALAAAAGGGGGSSSSSSGGSNGGGTSACTVTYSQCCTRAGSGGCGISPSIQPTSCGCPSPARSNGICNAGAPCNTTGGINAGALLCTC